MGQIIICLSCYSFHKFINKQTIEKRKEKWERDTIMTSFTLAMVFVKKKEETNGLWMNDKTYGKNQ